MTQRTKIILKGLNIPRAYEKITEMESLKKWVLLSLSLSFLLMSACSSKTQINKKSNTVKVKPAAVEERLRWQKVLNLSDPRCLETELFEQDSGIGQYPFERGISLVVVTCSLGTYQGDSLLYLLKGEKAQLLQFQQFQSVDIGELDSYRDTLLSGIVQTESRGKGTLIKVWRKYRGIGDCGQLLRYKIENGQAKLIELRVRECGDQTKFVPPEQWLEVNFQSTDNVK